MILCHHGETKKPSIYSHFLDLNEEVLKDHFVPKYVHVECALDAIINEQPPTTSSQKTILLFDEAQHLLNETENTGFLFRCVRWWLRKLGREQQVVAIFAGTTSQLTNFYEEPAERSTASRDVGQDHLYATQGKDLYPPFHFLDTIGCVRVKQIPNDGTEEYVQSISYGRPLFAQLQKKNKNSLRRSTSSWPAHVYRYVRD